jgi:hypothetical protein
MLHFCVAFRALNAFAKNLVSSFSVQAAEAVEDVTCVFEAFVCFLAAVGDLGVDSNVVVAAVAE